MQSTNQSSNQIIVDNKVQSFFIRTLCSYEPFLDKGLPGKGLKFKPGDLLLVLNANDDQWWQAVHIRRNLFLHSTLEKMVNAGVDITNLTEQSSNAMISSAIKSKERGLIPSLDRVQSKSRSQKRHVEFDSRAIVIGPTGKLLSEMISSGGGSSSFDLKRMRKFNNNRRPLREGTGYSLDSDSYQNSPEGNNNAKNGFVPPYEIIEQSVIKKPRPIIVIGPGKDALYEYFLTQYPDKFNTPIPHTTRPPRPGEFDGVDYHFMKNRAELEDSYLSNGLGSHLSDDNHHHQQHHNTTSTHTNNNNQSSTTNCYIDVGKFKGHLYASSVKAVETAINLNRHPLLDVSHFAIERLRSAQIYPICILIGTTTLAQTKLLQATTGSSITTNTDTNKQHTAHLDAQALREYTMKLEKEFAVLFDVIISPNSINEMREKVLQLINAYQRAPTWVRADNQNFS